MDCLQVLITDNSMVSPPLIHSFSILQSNANFDKSKILCIRLWLPACVGIEKKGIRSVTLRIFEIPVLHQDYYFFGNASNSSHLAKAVSCFRSNSAKELVVSSEVKPLVW